MTSRMCQAVRDRLRGVMWLLLHLMQRLQLNGTVKFDSNPAALLAAPHCLAGTP